MKFFKNCFLEWQFYPKFHLSYKKVLDEEFLIFDHYLCIAFWQFRWVSSAIPKDM